jgi:hypothetical protein
MILPENALVWLYVSSCLIISVIIYFCIREGSYEKANGIRGNFKIEIISKSLRCLASLVISFLWMPVCQAGALKLNLINYKKTLYTDIYKIEDIDVIKTKRGRAIIHADYTCLKLLNVETNKEVKLYLSSKTSVKHGVAYIKLTYYKGNLGWYILTGYETQ